MTFKKQSSRGSRVPDMFNLARVFGIEHLKYNTPYEYRKLTSRGEQNAFWLGILEFNGELEAALAGRPDLDRYYSKVLCAADRLRNSPLSVAYRAGLDYFKEKQKIGRGLLGYFKDG